MEFLPHYVLTLLSRNGLLKKTPTEEKKLLDFVNVVGVTKLTKNFILNGKNFTTTTSKTNKPKGGGNNCLL